MVGARPAGVGPGAASPARGYDRHPELLEPRVLQLSAGQGFNCFLGTAADLPLYSKRFDARLLRNCRHIYTCRRLYHLSVAMVADSLAALVDREVPGRMAGRPG